MKLDKEYIKEKGAKVWKTIRIDDGYLSEEYETKPIPKDKRKKTWIMGFIMLGFSLFSATAIIGFTTTAGLLEGGHGFSSILVTVIVGNLILTVYICLLSFIGAEEGLSTHQLSTKVFGKHGIKITSSVTMIAQLGWFGVGIMMIVTPLTGMITVWTNMDNSGAGFIALKWVMIIVIGFFMTFTAYYGIKSLTIVSIIVVPLIIIAGIATIAIAGIDGPNPESGSDWEGGSTTTMAGIGLVFAAFASGGTLCPDFVRWAKDGKSAVLVTCIAFFFGSILMFLFGSAIYFIFASGTHILAALGSVSVALLVIGILVLIGNIWTTSDNGLYTQAMALSSTAGTKKKVNVIVLGILGTLLSPLIFAHFIPFLNILNLLLPGIGTLICLNYFWHKEDKSDVSHSWIAIWSWFLGFVSAFIVNLVFPFILPLYVMIFTAFLFIIMKQGNAQELRWQEKKLKKSDNIKDE